MATQSKIQFIVPGRWIPEAKRTYTLGTQRYAVRRVDTGRAKDFKAAVRYAARQAYGDESAPLNEPLVATYIFRRPKPQSYRKHENVYWKGPDCDNLAKIVGDALQGVVFANDSAIVELHVSKEFWHTWEVAIIISTYADWAYQTPSTGIGAVIGKWPGDETDEEIQPLLDDIS